MNNYFCVLPFFGVEYAPKVQKTACCLLKQPHNLSSIRQDMLNGHRPSACQSCWSLEDNGITSDRQIKNKTFDYYSNTDIKYIEERCHNGKYSEQIVKITTSNLCNATCVTCNAQASTAWGSLCPTTTPTHFTISNETLMHLDYANIQMLSFVGGEPLYERKNFQILEELIRHQNTECFISFVTNGSRRLNETQFNTLKHFTNLNICVSIDGINDVYEYMRFPLKWPELERNLEIYRQFSDLSASYTISNVNVLYYHETTDWFVSNGIPFNHNIVRNPTHFNPNVLPESLKEARKDLSLFFRDHSENDDIQFALFCKEIKTQDRLKQINIKNYLPEISEIISQYELSQNIPL